MGSFEAELEKTSQMMSTSPEKNSSSLDIYKFLGRSIHFEASERSKDFNRFLPTTMPGFIGDVFGDKDLEDMLKTVIHDLEQDDDEESPSQISDNVSDLQSDMSTTFDTDCSLSSSVTKNKKKKNNKNKNKKKKKAKKEPVIAPQPAVMPSPTATVVESPATISKSDLWLLCNPKVPALTQIAMVQMLMVDFESVVYSMERYLFCHVMQ
jgi:hypothetical protein